MTDTAAPTTKAAIDELLEDDDLLDALDDLDDEDRRWLLDAFAKRLGEWAFDIPGMRNEKALLAMAMLGKVDWLAYGGAAGGGKTEVGLKHAYDLSLAIPNHSTLVLRTSKPELRRSIVFRSVARFRKLKVRAKLRNQENVLAWHFADSGAIIEFGFCARDEDVGQFLSAEYGLVWFDEATQFSFEQMMSIIGRCRVTVDQAAAGAREHVLFTTNPGSQSHMWFYEFFVQPTNYGEFLLVLDISRGLENARVARVLPAPQTVAEAEAMDDIERTDDELVIAFIPAFVSDNPHLAKSYRRSLLTLPEVERKQKLDGDWDTYDGQFFDEFRHDVHVIPSFEIPPDWPRARGVDWGFAAPWCCLWGAWDPDGDLHVYRELYGRRVLNEDQAKQAVAASMMLDAGVSRPERFMSTAADPSVFASTGTGLSIAQQWGKHGFHVQKANNVRPVGWSNIRAYLRIDEDLQRPAVKIHDCCSNLIRTLPRMLYDPHKPEDLDTTLEDHACDAFRYLAMLRPISRRRAATPQHRSGLEGRIDRMFEKMRRSERHSARLRQIEKSLQERG